MFVVNKSRLSTLS